MREERYETLHQFIFDKTNQSEAREILTEILETMNIWRIAIKRETRTIAGPNHAPETILTGRIELTIDATQK